VQKVLIAFAMALMTLSTAALADDKADAVATVQQFVDALNKGDLKAAAATCAEQTSIIDDFAPHEWHGAGACGNWANDFVAFTKQNGISEARVTLTKARHADVTGDRAYVVVPATFSYKMKGKSVKEKGGLTASLQKAAAGWRMTGWTWTKG